MEDIKNKQVYSIEEGVKFLDDNFYILSSDDYRAYYKKLITLFLKEEFGIEDFNSISGKDYKDLYEKLIDIEIEEIQEADDDEASYDSIHSPRRILASSLTSEMEDTYYSTEFQI